jgi:hypothetical protein
MSQVFEQPEYSGERLDCLAGRIGFEVRRETGKE